MRIQHNLWGTLKYVGVGMQENWKYSCFSQFIFLIFQSRLFKNRATIIFLINIKSRKSYCRETIFRNWILNIDFSVWLIFTTCEVLFFWCWKIETMLFHNHGGWRLICNCNCIYMISRLIFYVNWSPIKFCLNSIDYCDYLIHFM